MQKIELEHDAKPSERKPSISCGVRGCEFNMFSYCQTMPDIDDEGKCKTRRD